MAGRRFRRLWREERGAQVVEMAMSLLLLLLLLAGVIDMGRAFHEYIVITNAAREGARYASRFPWLSDSIRDQVILEAAESGVTIDKTEIEVSPENWTDPPPSPTDPAVAQPGDPVRVTVHHSFSTIMSGILGFGSIPMSVSTEMVVFGAK